MLQNVSHLSNNLLFLPHMLFCGLGVYSLSHDNLSIQLIQKKLSLYEYPSVPAQIAKCHG